MWILGIAGSHNGAAALVKDGKVIVAIQAERLVRQKRCGISLGRMSTAAVSVIRYCLDYAGIDLPDLTAIATSTPWSAIHPKFATRDNWNSIQNLLPPFITVPHHLAHAEYVLHYSPLRECLVLICDGSGTYEADRCKLDIQEQELDLVKYIRDTGKESISAYSFDGSNLRLIYRLAYGEAFAPGEDPEPTQLPWLASLGQLWRWCSFYCHGDSSEAGKAMGLAPFGDPSVHASLNTLFIDSRGEVFIDIPELCHRFRSPNSTKADISYNKHYEDIAAHIQDVTNRFLVDLVKFLQGRFQTPTICYSGGVALNGIANQYLQSQLGLDLHMNGSCEDNGTAIGAALAAYYKLTGERVAEEPTEYYGREYSGREIGNAFSAFAHEGAEMPYDELLPYVARELAAGKVVGWFQGRSEFGPRALGNRSILADPRRADMQDILNHRIKFREAFRPYSPSVVEDRAHEFFDLERPSPFMLRVVPVLVDYLPAIRHVDGTARVQTVNRRQNSIFYDLLKAFEEETGVPVLLNTSFNLAGEPIVESPEDALKTFCSSSMDLLVLGTLVLRRP